MLFLRVYVLENPEHLYFLHFTLLLSLVLHVIFIDYVKFENIEIGLLWHYFFFN